MHPTTDLPSTGPQSVVVLLEPANRQALDAERGELLAIRLPDEIASPREYSAIAAEQERVNAFVKRAKPIFDENCDLAHKAWKSACNLRSLFFDGLDAFNARARTLLSNYRSAQEQIRREAERRLAEEARLEEEARRKREAKLLEKQGHKEMAAAVRQAPVDAPAISLPSAVPVVQGLSFREDWKWEPVSGNTLEGKAAAVTLVPREYLCLDEVKLNGIARSMKGTLKIPGIRFFKVDVPVRK